MARPPVDVVELHHALGDVVGVVVGQRDHARAEPDALGALAGSRQEHLRRGNHLPTAGVVLAAPELVVAEPVEVLHEVEVAAELQHRMLANGMMKGREMRQKRSRGIRVLLSEYRAEGTLGAAPRRGKPQPRMSDACYGAGRAQRRATRAETHCQRPSRSCQSSV